MHSDDNTTLLTHLARIATALDAMVEQLECLCRHFGAVPKGKGSRKSGGSK